MAYNKETGMHKGYIYLITNKINQKKYIGQTRQDFKQRMRDHASKAKHNKTNSYLHSAIRKYGWDNFTKEIIETIKAASLEELVRELNEKEIYYIKHYNSLFSKNGYNISEGGNRAQYSEKEIDVYDLEGRLLQSYKNKNLVADFYKITPGAVLKVCNGQTYIARGTNVIFRYKGDPYDKFDFLSSINRNKIYKFSLSGRFLGEYANAVEAAKSLNLNEFVGKTPNATITCAIANRTGVAFGYYWNKVNSFDFDITHYRNYVPVNAYDPETKQLVKSYINLSSAAIDVCGKRSGISSILRSCSGENKYPVYGYIWRFAYDRFETYEARSKRIADNEVDQYDFFGNLIATYKNVTEALLKNNIDMKHMESVKKCLIGKRISCQGYIWRIHNHAFLEFPIQSSNKKMINCYSIDGVYIRTFISGMDAGKWISNDGNGRTQSNGINNCCNHRYGCITAYGYKWYYADDPNQPDKSKIISLN